MRIKGMVGGLLRRYRSRRGRRSGFRHLEQPATSIAECLEVRNLLAAFVVDTVVDESDGDMSAGDLSLREAIETANAQAGADTITFSPAVFGSAQTIDLLLGQFAVTDELTITGPGQDLLTIDAQRNSRHFLIDDEEENNEIAVAISDMTLTKGLATDGNDNTPSIEEAGGAVSARENLRLSSMSILDSETLSHGGAVYSAGTAEISDSRVVSNEARSQGGGIFNEGILIVTTSELVDNLAANSGGGGLYNFSAGAVELSASLVELNRASAGGGIVNAGTMLIRDTLVQKISLEAELA